MNVLLINPWAVVNDEYYASGFVSGMNQYVRLDFVTNRYYNGVKPNGQLYNVFFKKSQMMKTSRLRKVVRGFEYLLSWRKVIRIVSRGKYDIVHIHWLLMYCLDIRFLKMILEKRKKFRKLILTAHNVIPHIDGEKSIKLLKEIYNCFDVILVHGESIKKEFEHYFPELSYKVYIQFHGEYYKQNTMYELDDNDARYQHIMNTVKRAKRTYIMFGAHYYNKGTDRLLKVWKDCMRDMKSLLIILGSIDDSYVELQEEIKSLPENVLLFEGFVEDNFLNYCIANSDCICIPYRHASMSGIIYTAASFKKMTICTECGAIAEYLEDNVDSIICENSEMGLVKAFEKVEMMTEQQVNEMGKLLYRNIHTKYNWDIIVKDLYQNVYQV